VRSPSATSLAGALAVVAGLLGACTAHTSIDIQPPSASAFPLAVDCGPLPDQADCADGASAMDARVVIPPGSRAVIAGTEMSPAITIYGPAGKLFYAVLVRNPNGRRVAADLQTYR
jgi:hypothetical protein